jgi:hypothetical protein
MNTQAFPSSGAIARPIDFYFQMGKEAIRHSKAQGTRDAYARDWRQFTRWCREHKQIPLPATVPTIVAYLSYLASLKRRPTTMGRRLVSISLAHKTAGFDSPVASIALREAMKGFRRILPDPIVLADIRAHTMAQALTWCARKCAPGISDFRTGALIA